MNSFRTRACAKRYGTTAQSSFNLSLAELETRLVSGQSKINFPVLQVAAVDEVRGIRRCGIGGIARLLEPGANSGMASFPRLCPIGERNPHQREAIAGFERTILNQQTVVTALPRRDNPDTPREIEAPLRARCIRSAENRGVVQ